MKKTSASAPNGSWETTVDELKGQRAARNAVLAVRLLPDLERKLFSKLEPRSESIMVHQLCFCLQGGAVGCPGVKEQEGSMD